MADCPKCVKCLKNGLIGQTYRLAGSQNVRCHDCQSVYRMNSFEPIEFQWRDKKDEWSDFMKTQGVDLNATA